MSDLSKAYTEVYSILNFVDEYYVSKISSKFIEYMYHKKDDSYIPNIDMSIPLEEQQLQEDTVNILAMLKYNYWCETEQEKQELVNILNKNEEKYQAELREKYNPDNLFKKEEIHKEEIKQNTALIEYKESIFKRIFNKIKNIFKREN